MQYNGIESLFNVSNDMNGVLFLIDEIHLEFNSLESRNISIEEMIEFSQQRKQRKHIVGTSQVYMRLAKPLREQIKDVVLCKNFGGVLQHNILIDGENSREEGGEFIGEVRKHFWWFHSPELYGCYDTYAKMQRYKRSGKAKHVLLLLLILPSLILRSNALALQPLEDGTDRAVDLESGDIYVWDPDAGSSGMYVLEPKEVVTEYVTLPTDQNDIELLTLQNNVSELEERVIELNEENENLINTISDLENEVSSLEDQISVMAAYDTADENLGTTNVALFEGIIEKSPMDSTMFIGVIANTLIGLRMVTSLLMVHPSSVKVMLLYVRMRAPERITTAIIITT